MPATWNSKFYFSKPDYPYQYCPREIEQESQTWATYVILKFLVATLKKNRLNISITHFIYPQIQDSIISTCEMYEIYCMKVNVWNVFNVWKLLMQYFIFFFVYCVFEITSHLYSRLATFQMFSSFMWLLATILDSTEIDKCGCLPPLFASSLSYNLVMVVASSWPWS